MKIIEVEISEIKENPNNAKNHLDSQVEKISESINEFGFNNPILIDEKNMIIAGHGRFLAAKRSGYDVVPCVQLSHLSEEQKRAYIIADNKLSEIGGGWNEDILKLELQALRDMEDFDEFLTGFSEVELDDLLEAEQEISEAEEVLHEQSLQLTPAKEYIIILAEEIDDWDEMKKVFKLKTVRRGGYKKGSPFNATGTQRVLLFKTVKKETLNA